MERRANITCEAVARTLHVAHCGSCHQDEDDGIELLAIKTQRGEVGVCCKVYFAWLYSA